MRTHKNLIVAFGLLALCAMVLGSFQVVNTASGSAKGTTVSYTVQSAHNYANNYDYTWTISKSGASKMRVYFYRYQVETNYDFIYVMDKNGAVKQTLTSSTSKYYVWSTWVDGDAVKIRLKTDSSVTYYGFKITKYEYETSTVPPTDTDGGALTSGVAKSGTLPAGDQSDMFYIDVGANAQSMYVALTCGTCDFDDYGKFNAQPTTSSYDWRGYTSGGEENTVTSPAQGRHYIMVNKYSGDGGYTLTATITYGTTPADTTAPTVAISSPTNGATVSGTVTISFTASDANGISSRAIKIDGVSKSTSSSYSWDTTAYSNAAHTIRCEATDPSGNTGYQQISVTVSNTVADTTAPTVAISSPANGATVSATVTISFTASDANGISTRAIKIDGVSKSTSSSYSWDTTTYSNAAHTIRCEATDPSGNTGYQQISVTVSNSVPTDDGGALTNGVAANGNMDSADGADMFWIDVDANAQSMYVVLTCGSADFDTYGKFNAQPTTSSYDWRGYTSGGEENTVTSPAQGRHYIMVDYYSGSGPYTLTATITYGGGGGGGSWGTGGKYAIIVGISDYQSISDLSYCDEDATDWYNFLNGRGYECHVFGDTHTSNYPRYDGLATEANVRAAIQELATHAVAGDEVFFATSGHGSGTGTGSSYLCMYDCSGSAGCYYDTEIAADCDNFAMGVNLFVFIDHCYSGGIGPELMGMPNKAYVYCTTTCTANGYGYDEPTYQNGAWTYEYLQKYWVPNPTASAESIYDQASATYPHTGGDACMEFDGNTGASFYN